jgi:N-acetylglucosamine malate deacetylase 1
MKAKKASIIAMAVAAHPDDIEFVMAGTLLRLKKAGAEIHLLNIANGSCGTSSQFKYTIVQQRTDEAIASAKIAGAVMHPPLVDDFEIFFERNLLARVAAIIRVVQPDILLVPSIHDYLEDHQNTCRLAVTGAFVREMRNFQTSPAVAPFHKELAIYHSLPHGLHDCMRQRIFAGQYVDIAPVFDLKKEMLSQHKTQKEWLDISQGMNSYLKEMERMCREMGKMSGRFELAEGWRRHNHIGFSKNDYDPLTGLLGKGCWIDPDYENALEMRE